MSSLGDIVVGLRMDHAQFGAGAAKGRGDIRSIAEAAQQTKSQGLRAFMELSRGVEDAATQWGTQGFAGAIRAGSNNLTQAAALMGPMTGMFASIGAAIATLVLPRLQRWMSSNDAASVSVENFADRSVKAIERIRAANRVGDDIKHSDGTFGSLRKMNEGKQTEILRIDEESAAIRAKLAETRAAIARETGDNRTMVGGMFGWLTGTGGNVGSASSAAAVKKYQEQVTKLEQELKDRAAKKSGLQADIGQVAFAAKRAADDAGPAASPLARQLDLQASQRAETLRDMAAVQKGMLADQEAMLSPVQKINREYEERIAKLNELSITDGLFAKLANQARSIRDDKLEKALPVDPRQQEAKRLVEQNRTPAEKAQVEIARLRQLRADGLIDDTTLQRATQQTLQQAAGQEQKPPSSLIQGKQQGTLEAFQASLGRDPGKKLVITAEQQLIEQKLTNKHLAAKADVPGQEVIVG